MRIDLGCGANKREGFTGVDASPDCGADIVHDLTVTPWPFDAESVDEIFSSHFVEHLDGKQRIAFMEEAYRVLKPGAQMTIITPHWNSIRAIQDPTHAWPPVSENMYLYFNKGWRDQNKLSHYGINCDFDFTYGYALDGDVSVRNVDYQQFAMKHYTNAILDLHVTLTKREKAND